MTDAHVYDMLPAYVLGSLDSDDLLAVARHLPGCPACRAALADYWATVDALAAAAPPRTPPPDLRARVIARVGGSQPLQQEVAVQQEVAKAQQEVAAQSPIAKAQQPARPQAKPSARAGWAAALQGLFSPRLAPALGLLALVLLVALAAGNLLLWQRVNALQAAQPTALPMHLVHLAGTEKAPQAVGYLMVFKGEAYGSLTVDNAPPLDNAHQYQIWLVADGKRENGGVFSVTPDGYDTLQIQAIRPLDQYQSFGITVEPTGGSPGPTGPKVLGGKL